MSSVRAHCMLNARWQEAESTKDNWWAGKKENTRLVTTAATKAGGTAKTSNTGKHPIIVSRTQAEALAQRLRRKLKGEVRFDDGFRALYATDGSNYRQTPIGVIRPKDEEDVLEAFALCRQIGAPITSRGCGTSLAGQCCNVAVIIDYTKYMNRILEIDPQRKIARCNPGWFTSIYTRQRRSII
jgi:FAD binding domain-containing protein